MWEIVYTQDKMDNDKMDNVLKSDLDWTPLLSAVC